MQPIVKTSRELLQRALPKRDAWSHKGEFGRVFIISGSVGYTGAPVLAATAALRTGSGLIFVMVPQSVYGIVAGKLIEPMVFPCPDQAGQLSRESIDGILQRLPSCDACLIGPGLGQSEDIQALVQAVLKHSRVPVVLDADGLNVLSGHIDILRETTCPVILTPHEGEFTRLLGAAPERDMRLSAAKDLAAATSSIVLLKGHETVVTDGQTVYLNQTGNPGMATGGSGDVLAGVILSLLGQKVEPLLAAACGAWLHGAAGDLCEKKLGQCGLTPMDMVQAVPRLLK